MSKRIDQIRAMNVEELAELLDDIADDACEFGENDEYRLKYPCSASEFSAWLLEEVD